MTSTEMADRGSRFSMRNRLLRLIWQIVWLLLFRPTPRPFTAWRNWLLRRFGAQIGSHVHVMPSAKIWAPWNLRMGDHAALGDDVDCYSVALVEIGANALVSQYSFLCTASHDHERMGLPGFDAPIRIGPMAWVCADVYVGPGVTIGEGTVIGARASVFQDVPPWVVALGNPARIVKDRKLRP